MTQIPKVASVLAALIVSAPLANAQLARVRDSVGIRIIENPSRLRAPIVFTLGKPTFDVGGLESDPSKEFLKNTAYLRGVRLSDGRVAVLDYQRIQFFDAAGKRQGMTGREGKGPGEFLNITALCRTRGDTIVVSDGQGRRLAILDKGGTFVRHIPLDRSYAENSFCFDDGTFLIETSQPTARDAPQIIRVTRNRLDGTVANAIADLNFGVFDMAVMREATVRAMGQRVVFGDAATHELRVFTPTGRLTMLIRTDDRLEPVTQQQLEERGPIVSRAGATPAEMKAMAADMAARSTTKTWPTYKRFELDGAGRFWIEDYVIGKYDPTAAVGWTAFDADGRLVGRLMIPATSSRDKAMRVVGFGRDEVFVRRPDDDGAQHLVIFPLVRVSK